MKDEYWATFSIYDHRTALFRQALVLFDRIVVPIPTRTVGSLTEREIERLDNEVEHLKKEGAAEKVDWDPEEFAQWRDADGREAGHQEAIARRLVKDPPYLTRLQLKEQTEKRVAEVLPPGTRSVTAVPVYGTQQAYDFSTADLKRYWVQEKVTLEIVLKQIPVPSKSASFDDILFLRNRASFQASLAALRKWQRDTVREVLAEDSQTAVERAASDFAKMVTKYAGELSDVRYDKATTAVSSLLAVGAALSGGVTPLVAVLAGVAPPIFAAKKLLKPCWKSLEDKQCFPAGVVYEAKDLAMASRPRRRRRARPRPS